MSNPASKKWRGIGRVLIAIYAVLALAATGRSIAQIIERFNQAPLAFSLSAVAALVYIVITLVLLKKGVIWQRVAWGALIFELLGVLIVGTLSVFDAELFPRETVWSWYGRGYLFVPLVLPLVGMWWLARNNTEERAT